MSAKKLSVPPHAPAPTPRMLGVKAAAQYLGATEWFIRSQVWAGKLPHLVFGKRIVFDLADLNAFIEARKSGVAA